MLPVQAVTRDDLPPQGTLQADLFVTTLQVDFAVEDQMMEVLVRQLVVAVHLLPADLDVRFPTFRIGDVQPVVVCGRRIEAIHVAQVLSSASGESTGLTASLDRRRSPDHRCRDSRGRPVIPQATPRHHAIQLQKRVTFRLWPVAEPSPERHNTGIARSRQGTCCPPRACSQHRHCWISRCPVPTPSHLLHTTCARPVRPAHAGNGDASRPDSQH